MNESLHAEMKRMKPLGLAGILIGIGMGGFFDGIFFHQIIQIHNMVSNRLFPDTVVNAEINMFWDGIFHVFTWVITAFGIGVTWRIAKRGNVPLVTKFYVGSMALGWGLFNLIEGIIDHHILQVHHVVQRAVGVQQVFWDLAFLASGAILIGVGVYIRRRSFVSVSSRAGAADSFTPARA